MAKCPAHDDHNPSLSIKQGNDGRTLLHCFAGCRVEDICAAIGITTADLFDGDSQPMEEEKRIEAIYPYHDADGTLLFEVVRYEPKGFSQRRPDPNRPNRFIWETRGVKKVLFRLPETIAAIAKGDLIYLCEGEKDVLAMVEKGFSATCNPGGADKWQDSYTETLRNADVVIIADKDDAGRKHAQLVARKLHGAAKSIRVLELPDVKGKPVKDAADFFEAGGDAEQIRELVKKTPQWTPGAVSGNDFQDNETFNRLAKLSPAEYDRCRETEAERLKIRVSTLDAEVQKRRAPSGEALQESALDLPDVELWPEPVNGAEVLSEIADDITRYMVLPKGAANAIALWVAHTHCFESFLVSPRLFITSPVKGCGKTTLRDIVALFVSRPLVAENLTPAVLFRVIQLYKPTVLADECDGWMKDNNELNSLLNSGHRRGGKAWRCEGENHKLRSFLVFSPVVLCGIGSLPDTLYSRSIVIRLECAKPGELHQEFDDWHTEYEHELCRKLARFVADNRHRIESSKPKLPDGAYNRLAHMWRPLFAIAETAGGDWPQRAASAFASLTGREDLDSQNKKVILLGDIKEIFDTEGVDKLTSTDLTKALANREDRDWAEWGNGQKPITPNQLARLLRPFNIAPRTIRLPDGTTAKGYCLEMFKDTFERFLPHPPLSNRHTVTMPVNTGGFAISETSQAPNVLRIENAKNANKNAGCDGVTVQKRGKEKEEALLL